MEALGKFERLLAGIAVIDAKLADTIRQLEVRWKTGEPRDGELTELVAGVLQSAVDAGLLSFETMVRGFNTYAHDFSERQLDFLRFGRYRATSYEEVYRDVYANEAFLRTTYYPALLLSYLAAPNYRHIFRRFDRILTTWRAERVARVLEIGSGHALLMLFALRQLPEAIGLGTDIAPAAAAFALALDRITAWATSRFHFEVTDVLQEDSSALGEPFDAVICCEFLEHVPEPARFLRAAHRHLRTGGRLFVSAAVRMESVDHLTLFGSTDEVAALLAGEGFEVIEDMSVPFVTRRPRDAAHWNKLLHNPQVAATFVAEYRKV